MPSMWMRAALTCLVVVSAASSGVGQRGLHLHFEGEDDDGVTVTDDRRARTVALQVAAGAAATPFFALPKFRARWQGKVEMPRRDRYRFTFCGVGHCVLRIDGEVVFECRTSAERAVTSEPLPLRGGSHDFVVDYTNLPGVVARLRLEWESRRFAREPMPPAVFSHDAADPALYDATLRRRGRTMTATHGCLACHVDVSRADNFALPEIGMPEISMRGPELDDVGRRLMPGWVESWLRDPRVHRADARMPRVLRGDAASTARDAGDLAAFLLEQRRGEALAVASAGDAVAGASLFSDLGCIACHDFGGAAQDPARPIDLRHVGAKYRPAALVAFLRDPRRYDPWIEMPDFDLDEIEAANLAAFLRSRSDRKFAVTVGGDAQRGRQLAAELGCAACHSIDGIEHSVKAKPLAEILNAESLQRGCVADAAEARGAAPDYGFDQGDRAALRAFAASGREALERRSALEFAARQIEARRCQACHSLDGQTDHWTRREGRLAELGINRAVDDGGGEHEVVAMQLRPALTWAGDKLRGDWLEAFFAGRLQDRPRPWLRARMPTFPLIADGLAAGLAEMHGHAPRTDESSATEAAPLDRAQAKIGETLVGAAGGFGCVTCHGLGERPPLAVFEVQGINLAQSGVRLRDDYFMRWMWDPQRIDASARMPKYADDRGKTPFVQVLDGDARRQYGAIWAFLRSMP